jgi:hypothetical protein
VSGSRNYGRNRGIGVLMEELVRNHGIGFEMAELVSEKRNRSRNRGIKGGIPVS